MGEERCDLPWKYHQSRPTQRSRRAGAALLDLGLAGQPVGATDLGLADPAPLLQGLRFPKMPDETIPWGKCQTLLLRKLGQALANGATEMVLEPRDLEELAAHEPPPLPDAFAVTAALAAPSPEALTRGEFRVLLSGVSGPSGARRPLTHIYIPASLR